MHGEAEVFGGIGFCFGVLKGATSDFRWTFAIGAPGVRIVDGCAVDVQPFADVEQDGALGIRDAAIGAWADVEE